ncbi:MAG: type VI secretion system Vgr family protein [Pyrinomonadaceae bacterium]
MALKQKGRNLLINTPLGEDFLLLEEFTASETISELFAFQLKLVHEENGEGLTPTVVDPKQLLGQLVGIKINLPDKTSRYFNGVVSHWRQRNRDPRFTYYQAIVVPKVWILTQKRQSRIFQRLTVPQILKKVFSGFNVKQEFVGTFNRREYCVQYQETDFDFAARLMEEEGIYYYFEHTAGDHKMILANTPLSHRDCPSQSKFPFEADLTRKDGALSSIITWETAFQLQTGKVTVWDHNFELPNKKLEADQPSLYPVANNAALEIFQYPGEYGKRYTGIDRSGGDQSSELQHVFEDNRHQAELQMQAIDAKYKVAYGTSNSCPLTVGYKFEIFNHPAKGTDGQYMLTHISHHAVQSPTLETEPKTIQDAYTNSFSCISLKTGSTPFRPIRKTPKSKIMGSQTAVVVGPAGEEIFTDKYGRIKAQFHWDREGKYDVGSSCWMRVAQPWAGHDWGSIAVPRIGQEVVVEFLEGDPDRPLVVGSVYNPAQMPPYELPANSHTMGFKSNTTKGGNGYNEIVIVDGKAGELIRVHAQKDMDTTVLNNDTQYVVVDRTNRVDGNQHETVKGHKTTIVEKGNRVTNVETGFQHNVVKEDILIESTANEIVVKSPTKITLQVGENSWIEITPGKITINSPLIESSAGGQNLIVGNPVDVNP